MNLSRRKALTLLPPLFIGGALAKLTNAKAEDNIRLSDLAGGFGNYGIYHPILEPGDRFTGITIRLVWGSAIGGIRLETTRTHYIIGHYPNMTQAYEMDLRNASGSYITGVDVANSKGFTPGSEDYDVIWGLTFHTKDTWKNFGRNGAKSFVASPSEEVAGVYGSYGTAIDSFGAIMRPRAGEGSTATASAGFIEHLTAVCKAKR